MANYMELRKRWGKGDYPSPPEEKPDMASTHCKFTLTETRNLFDGGNLDVTMQTIYDPHDIDDQSFNKYTPSGTLNFHICNENVLPMFTPEKIGKKYSVVITELE